MRKNDCRAATVYVPLDRVRIGERRRRAVNAATVERYRLLLEQGQTPPPVRLARDGDGFVVRDGRHRVVAALAAGHLMIEATLRRMARMMRIARAVLAFPGDEGLVAGHSTLSASTRPRRS